MPSSLLSDPPAYCGECGAHLVKPPAPELWPGSAPTDEIGTEARWNPDNKFVRNPQYWHSQDGESTEIEVSEMIAGLVRATQPEFVIETGSAWGQTTRYIGEALRANGHGFLVSLEPDDARRNYTAWYCHELLHGWLFLSPETSLEFKPDRRVDFLFSDSDMTVRTDELIKFWRYMDRDALIVVHDTVDPMLNQALNALDQFRSIRLHTPRGVTILEVLK